MCKAAVGLPLQCASERTLHQSELMLQRGPYRVLVEWQQQRINDAKSPALGDVMCWPARLGNGEGKTGLGSGTGPDLVEGRQHAREPSRAYLGSILGERGEKRLAKMNGCCA